MAIMSPSRQSDTPMLRVVRTVRRRLRHEFLKMSGKCRPTVTSRFPAGGGSGCESRLSIGSKRTAHYPVVPVGLHFTLRKTRREVTRFPIVTPRGKLAMRKYLKHTARARSCEILPAHGPHFSRAT